MGDISKIISKLKAAGVGISGNANGVFLHDPNAELEYQAGQKLHEEAYVRYRQNNYACCETSEDDAPNEIGGDS